MILTIALTVLLLPGLIGILLPIFPGVPYMWFVALIVGLTTHFAGLTLAEFGTLSILAGTSILVDYLSGLLGAKFGGASLRSLGVGVIGLFLGLLILPPFGGAVGLFLGIFISELTTFGSHTKAVRAATGGVIGSLAGSLINLGIGVGFLVYFAMHLN